MVRVVFASCPSRPCSAKDSEARKNGTAMRGKEFSYSFFFQKRNKNNDHTSRTIRIASCSSHLLLPANSLCRVFFSARFARSTHIFTKKRAHFSLYEGKTIHIIMHGLFVHARSSPDDLCFQMNIQSVGEQKKMRRLDTNRFRSHFSYSCNRSRYIYRSKSGIVREKKKKNLQNVNKIYLVAIVPIS